MLANIARASSVRGVWQGGQRRTIKESAWIAETGRFACHCHARPAYFTSCQRGMAWFVPRTCEVRYGVSGVRRGTERAGDHVGSSWAGNADEEVRMKARVRSNQASARAMNLAGQSGRGVGLPAQHHPRRGFEGASCQRHIERWSGVQWVFAGDQSGAKAPGGGREDGARASRWAGGGTLGGGAPAAAEPGCRRLGQSSWRGVGGRGRGVLDGSSTGVDGLWISEPARVSR